MSVETTLSPLEQLQDLLINTQNKANELLAQTSNESLSLGINSTLQRLINNVGFFTGITKGAETTKFEPIVIESAAITAPEQELNPNEEDKKAFALKVQQLEEALPNLSDEEVLKNTTLPEDEFALRAVAKHAGVEDFDVKEINLSFLAEIRTGLELKKENQLQEQTIDAAITAPEQEETTTE